MAIKPKDFNAGRRPVYSCDCLSGVGGKKDKKRVEKDIEELAQQLVALVATKMGEQGHCSVAGTRVLMRALVYSNVLQMTVMKDHNMAQPKNVAESQLHELMEAELVWADQNVTGIHNTYAKDEVLVDKRRKKEFE